MNFRRGAMLLTVALGLVGAPIRAENLGALSAQADAIVVASTSSHVESDTLEQFDLTILRTLKGPIGSGGTITVRWARPSGSGGGVRTGGVSSALTMIDLKVTGLWFLIKTKGVWDCLRARGGAPSFTSLYYPATPAGPAPDLSSLAVSDTEALVAELAAALEAPGSSHAPYALLDGVGVSDSAPIRAVLWHIVGSSGSVRDRAEALEALIGRGDTPAIRTIIEDPMLASFPGAAAPVVASVRDTFRAMDHTSVAALIRLANASPAADGLNSAAIRALSAIHSRETVPFLAALLSRPDQESHTNA
jgi:hypothetical protein